MKPKLYKKGGLWICEGRSIAAFGLSPRNAFLNWRQILTRNQQYKVDLDLFRLTGAKDLFNLNGQRCLFDELSHEDKKKPIGLACPCPKCTPRFSVA